MNLLHAFAATFIVFAASSMGGCSYVVDFDRTLLLDAGTDGEADAASQAVSAEEEPAVDEPDTTEARPTGPDGG